MPVDLTSVARKIGYCGKTPVLVYQGVVLSHRGITWNRFCERISEGRPIPKPSASIEQKIAKSEND
jgi:hypothetical protein